MKFYKAKPVEHNITLRRCSLLVTILGLLFSSISLWAGDRLLATGGVTQFEGAAGGGLVPWALIAGYGTQEQTGASAFYTQADFRDKFKLTATGVSFGFNNRTEVSFSQQRLGLGDTVPNETLRMNTLGIKVRLFGDAIYDQDRLMPQIALGAQLKHNEDFGFVPRNLNAKKSTGLDIYLSATKLYLAAIGGKNLLINVGIRATKANQFGFLGFGGDKNNAYQLQPEVSAALMLTDNFLLGMEYRSKPDNLETFKEEDAKDIFITWFPVKNLGLTAAYLDMGNIANKPNQTSWYFSGQFSY